VEDLVASLFGDDRLVHLERIPARPARYAALSRPFPDGVREHLPTDALWTHQAQAIDLVRDGVSVAVATGTASGKSRCYQLPIAEAVSDDPAGTALLLFPTKALAQDQLRALAAFDLPGLVPVCYDGDTDPDARSWARRHGSVVLSNPDMVHVALLPHHARWATFLMRLRYVVIDELHVLRGIFGTHVAHVLRRLRRVCNHYGSDPTFIFCSATIGEPDRLASALCGKPVTAVTDDGSPRGERLFALWNPPLLDEATGARGSANVETAHLLSSIVHDDHRAIAFCRSRKGTELVAADTRRRLPEALRETVRPYRGGYLTEERREIEGELFGGQLRGVVATSALELGIDIGSLDACVLDGFPGTIASMWQQAGRAGRTQRQSLAVLVAGDDQLDQWLMAHPKEVFERTPEPAVINPANPSVLLPHLACAAFELPLSVDDGQWWDAELLGDGVRELVQDDTLAVRDGRAFWGGRGAPAWSVGLRSGSSEEYRIADADGHLIGTVDGSRAFQAVHPGAVYLHQGQAWRVTDLDLDDRVAWVEPADGDELTQVRSETDIRVLRVDESRQVGPSGAGGPREPRASRAQLAERDHQHGPVVLHLGAVQVNEQVVGYQRRDVRTHELLGNEQLDLPPSALVTRAFWWTIDDDVLARAGVAEDQWPGTLHAAEHAMIGMLPLFTICDRWDVGGVSTALQIDTGTPTIFVYDGYPGGAGIAELGFEAGERLLRTTLEVITACGCAAGCPSCVQSPKCGNGNEPLEKAGATALLRLILGQ
jgi:DEAD/DEAH box helicase domain-containing protein